VLQQLVKAPQTRLDEFTIADGLREQAEAARRRGSKETITVTSTFTAEPLVPTLKYWLKELELPAVATFAPYQQVFQQLLDPSSLLAQNQRGANVILLRLQDLQEARQELVTAIKTAAGRNPVPLLLFICPPANVAHNGFAAEE